MKKKSKVKMVKCPLCERNEEDICQMVTPKERKLMIKKFRLDLDGITK